MADYRYYLGPWRRDAGSTCWSPPAGCVGALDLASPLTLAAADGGNRPIGFFASSTVLDGDYAWLGKGDCREIAANAAMRAAFRTLVGLPADPAGERLVDLVWDCLTAQSDPEGLERARPLVPTVAGNLELRLAGHSLVRAERFAWGRHPHTAKLKTMLRRRFQRAWQAARGGDEQDQVRRVLDFCCGKYRLNGSDDWRELVDERDQAAVAGRRKHATAIDDDFDRADQVGLGAAWAAVAGSMQIVAARAGHHGSTLDAACRHATALSGDDHWAQCRRVKAGTSGSHYAAPAVRVGDSQCSYYLPIFRPTLSGVFKRVAGAFLGPLAPLPAEDTPHLVRITADGSTISVHRDGQFQAAVTDTALSGNLYCGVAVRETDDWLDDFAAADIAVFRPAWAWGVNTHIGMET